MWLMPFQASTGVSNDVWSLDGCGQYCMPLQPCAPSAARWGHWALRLVWTGRWQRRAAGLRWRLHDGLLPVACAAAGQQVRRALGLTFRRLPGRLPRSNSPAPCDLSPKTLTFSWLTGRLPSSKANSPPAPCDLNPKQNPNPETLTRNPKTPFKWINNIMKYKIDVIFDVIII